MAMKKTEPESIIGTREIIKHINAGKIKKVLVAKNCPEELVKKIQDTGNVEIEVFNGDQSQLGTKLGKPFPIAMVGVTSA
jgi:large subunit ribosomal protein L30e